MSKMKRIITKIFYLEQKKSNIFLSAFTLIEVLIVIAIMLILMSSGASILSSRTQESALEASTKAVVEHIAKARNYAVTGYHADAWGVKVLDNNASCFNNGDCIVVFKGNDYATRDSAYDSIFDLKNGIVLASGQQNEFYFSKVAGWLSTTTASGIEISLDNQGIILNNSNNEMKMVAVSKSGSTFSLDSKFLNDYAYRREIIIDHTKVSGASHISFPVLISGTYAYLKTVANGGSITNSNGYDMIFTSDYLGGNVLSYEVEKYDATTGELIAWVNVPSVSYVDDTSIYIFYGNAAINTSQANPTGVWDATSYKVVLHMTEDPSGAAPQMLDSTSNNVDGTSHGSMTSADSVPGKIGKAVDEDGAAIPNTDYIDMGSSVTFNSGPQTLCAWVKMGATQVNNYSGIIAKISGTGDSTIFWDLYTSYDGGGLGMSFLNNVGGTYLYLEQTANLGSSNFRYVCGVYDGASSIKLYVDGVLLTGGNGGTISGTRATDTGTSLVSGNNYWSHTGIIDEVRVIKADRSLGWILTEYNNQNSPSTFYAIGSEVSRN